jgi:hypothetical protein
LDLPNAGGYGPYGFPYFSMGLPEHRQMDLKKLGGDGPYGFPYFSMGRLRRT